MKWLIGLLLLAAWSWHLPYDSRIGGQQFAQSVILSAGVTAAICGPFTPPIHAAIVRLKIHVVGNINIKAFELKNDVGDILADYSLPDNLNADAQLTRMIFTDQPLTTITVRVTTVGAAVGTLDIECTGGANGLPGQQSKCEVAK